MRGEGWGSMEVTRVVRGKMGGGMRVGARGAAGESWARDVAVQCHGAVPCSPPEKGRPRGTGSTSPSTWIATSPSSVSSKTRMMWKIASVAEMCERKALPRPSPDAAPLTRPAMSMTCREAVKVRVRVRGRGRGRGLGWGWG